MSKKVIVAMSGGVDSSVVAAMLKKEGYDVIGIFMNFWKDSNSDTKYENKCCSLESIQSARAVAWVIGIPFYVINVQNEFKKRVVDYFLDEIKMGNTPNPCVACNKEIKFKLLLEKMIALKADYVATGHYARIMKHKTWDMEHKFGLFEAKDKSKDQSYFLYKLDQKELSKILFPLGDYTKVEVRKMAKKFGLPVYDKEESQDICFVPKKGYENFLRKMLRLKKGKICDFQGKTLGTHEGLPLYTLGQRKGIKIGGRGPYYVVEKDFKRNTLVVGNEKDLFKSELKIKNVNWIWKKPKFPLKTLVKIRYKSLPAYGIIDMDKKYQIKILFDNPQRAVTPGQSAVFYGENGEVLGGGIIDNF